MQIIRVGVDLAKEVFHVHGVSLDLPRFGGQVS